MKFVSSGYSYLNYASTVRFLSALGHMETSFTINNAPDLIVIDLLIFSFITNND